MLPVFEAATTGPPGKGNGGGIKQMVELQEQILRKLALGQWQG
jgi:hypothetical protein